MVGILPEGTTTLPSILLMRQAPLLEPINSIESEEFIGENVE